jgi:hypothetical protein
MTATQARSAARCPATIQVRYTVRHCDKPAGHDGPHITNDGGGRPEYHWRDR